MTEEKKPRKRYLTKLGEAPKMVYSWTPVQAAKPHMVECDEEGTPINPPTEAESQEIQISNMNKVQLAKMAMEDMGLEIDQRKKVTDLRHFISEQKNLRAEAVRKVLDGLKGKEITKAMLQGVEEPE